VIRLLAMAMVVSTVLIVQLPRPLGAFEFVTFAGKGKQGGSHQQDGK
jgi:hypothetical protein